MNVINDTYGRSLTYLRLSVTEACNFKCRYCLPNGYSKKPNVGDLFEDSNLTLYEINNLVNGLSRLGVSKVRLSGGEPTLRTDIVEIVRLISKIEGIQTIALTTNGYRLDSLLEPLKDAGLNALNISLDSLNENSFEQITGSKLFKRVASSVFKAVEIGIPTVKINVVMLKSYLDENIQDFIDLVRRYPISVRFIELMETGDNSDFFKSEYVSGENLKIKFANLGWIESKKEKNSGPAICYSKSGYAGQIGVIAPYSKDFCKGCNRIRVTSKGKIKLCLFGEGEYPIRRLIQSQDQYDELSELVSKLILNKAPSHLLHQGNFGTTYNLAAIGG